MDFYSANKNKTYSSKSTATILPTSAKWSNKNLAFSAFRFLRAKPLGKASTSTSFIHIKFVVCFFSSNFGAIDSEWLSRAHFRASSRYH